VIALKTWRELRGMTLVYLLILELLIYPPVRLWPAFQEDMERKPSALLKLLPDFMRRWAESDYPSWMGLHQFFKDVCIAGIAAAVLFTTGAIARERETLTLEFLLARPVSRTRILWSKSWVTALCISAPVFLSSWSTLAMSATIGQSLSFEQVTMCSCHATWFVWMLAAVTLLFSVLCRTQVHVAFWTGGLVVIQVAIYFVPQIRAWSMFRLADFDVYGPILHGRVSWAQMCFGGGLMPVGTMWLAAATVALYFAAWSAFRRLEP
jgi:ABC-2 type transport system permease protein